MKKIFIMLSAAVLMMFVASCADSNKEVKEFVSTLAAAISNGDKDAVLKMYPDAAKAEAFNTALDLNGMTIEEAEGKFTVKLDSLTKLVIEKAEDGTMKVVESSNLFSYPKEKLDFAKATGWIEAQMNDKQIAEQFEDTAFVDFLAAKAKKELQSKVKVGKWEMPEMDKWFMDAEFVPDIIVPIENTNDFDISKDDYKLKSVLTGGITIYETRMLPGIDLPAGAKEKIVFKISDNMGYRGNDLVHSLVFDVPKDKLLSKYFKPVGDEYKEYKNNK